MNLRHSQQSPTRIQLTSAMNTLCECAICLESVKIPVNMTCFGRCSEGRTCTWKCVCLLCARTYLQLDKEPRHRDATVSCLICRTTKVDLADLNAQTAYKKNYPLMHMMDDMMSVGEKVSCTLCGEFLNSQQALEKHLNADCSDAMVKCKYQGCQMRNLRRVMRHHEQSCSHGHRRCGMCFESVESNDFHRHNRDLCPRRLVSCPLQFPHDCQGRLAACNLKSHVDVMYQQCADHMAEMNNYFAGLQM